MKRKIFLISVLFAMLFTVSCGKVEEIAHDELARRLINNVSFSEKLVEIDEIAIQKQLFLNPNDYSGVTMLVGTRATCDQIIIVDTYNETVIDEKVENYFENLKASYASYRPMESEKIDNVFKAKHKNTKVYIVATDAEKVNMVYNDYIRKR